MRTSFVVRYLVVLLVLLMWLRCRRIVLRSLITQQALTNGATSPARNIPQQLRKIFLLTRQRWNQMCVFPNLVNLAESATFFRMCKNMRVLHSHADREDVRSCVCPATHKDASTDTSVARMEEVNCKENGEDNSERYVVCNLYYMY